MIFGWFRRRRIAELGRHGLTLDAHRLRRGEAALPRRLVAVDLGYGEELWADYGAATRFRKQGRIVVDGKLLIDPGDADALANVLGLIVVRQVVKF